MLRLLFRKRASSDEHIAGWTLSEYAEKIEPDLYREYRRSIREFDYYDDLKIPEWIDSPCEHSRLTFEKETGLAHTQSELARYSTSLIELLRNRLENGTMSGWGSKAHSKSRIERIPERDWKHLVYWNFPGSCVTDRPANPTILYWNVKVVPPAHFEETEDAADSPSHNSILIDHHTADPGIVAIGQRFIPNDDISASRPNEPSDYYKPRGKLWNAIVDAIFELNWQNGAPRNMSRQKIKEKIANILEANIDQKPGDRTMDDVLKLIGI